MRKTDEPKGEGPPKFRLRVPSEGKGRGDEAPRPTLPGERNERGVEQQPQSATLAGAVFRYLAGIETWRQVAIALVLGGSVLLGYLIFQNPERFFGVIDAITREKPAPRELQLQLHSDLSRQLREYLQALQPNCVGMMMWRTSVYENRQYFEAYAVVPELEPTAAKYANTRWRAPLPLFIDNPHVNLMITELMRGHFICGPSKDLWDVIKNMPMTEVCLIGVPAHNLPLVAFIAAGFREALSEGERERVQIAMSELAERVIYKRL